METKEICHRDAESGRAVIPVAAGAEMVNMLADGIRCTCALKDDGQAVHGKVILCHVAQPYLPPLGQNIRRLRLSCGMTQRQLAMHLRVSMQAVSKWERDQTYPDMSLLVPIARLFRVTLDELFGCG